jgi:hypothetical protein
MDPNSASISSPKSIGLSMGCGGIVFDAVVAGLGAAAGVAAGAAGAGVAIISEVIIQRFFLNWFFLFFELMDSAQDFEHSFCPH